MSSRSRENRFTAFCRRLYLYLACVWFIVALGLTITDAPHKERIWSVFSAHALILIIDFSAISFYHLRGYARYLGRSLYPGEIIFSLVNCAKNFWWWGVSRRGMQDWVQQLTQELREVSRLRRCVERLEMDRDTSQQFQKALRNFDLPTLRRVAAIAVNQHQRRNDQNRIREEAAAALTLQVQYLSLSSLIALPVTVNQLEAAEQMLTRYRTAMRDASKLGIDDQVRHLWQHGQVQKALDLITRATNQVQRQQELDKLRSRIAKLRPDLQHEAKAHLAQLEMIPTWDCRHWRKANHPLEKYLSVHQG